MISVLIPIYNYSVVDLVKELHKQLKDCKIPFEIICLEDGSDDDFVKQNEVINEFSNTSLIVSESNNGRIKSRQILSEQAKYDWLLFLDSDVLPKHKDFIYEYLKFVNSKNESVFGGICYNRKKPEKDFILRWKYGISKEEVNAERRNKNKYKNIVSANMLIKKDLFNSINSKIELEGYGLDNYFSALMKEMNTIPLHVDNEVIHLGVEKSDVYLKKIETAVLNLLKLYRDYKLINHENNLYAFFVVLKRLRLHFMFSALYACFKSLMKRNLLSEHPSISILQLYKISLMCNTYFNKSI